MAPPHAPIINRLKRDKALFVKGFDASGRDWFTRRMVQEAVKAGDADVESGARGRLLVARDRVKKRLDVARGASLKDDLTRAKRNLLRARILYGLMGVHPEVFVQDLGHPEVLDYILGRRFRALQRMLSYVNPNDGRGIFGYPTDVRSSQVNVQSRKFWEGTGTEKIYPFRLTADGKAKSQEAIETLFKPNPKKEKKKDRTLVDCPAATMIVHLDALLAAKNPKLLAEKLAAESSTYLQIDHPYGPLFLSPAGYRGGYGGSSTSEAGPGDDLKLEMLVGTLPQPSARLWDKSGSQPVEGVDPVRDPALVTESQTPRTDARSGAMQPVTVKVKKLDRKFAAGAFLSPREVDWFHAVRDDRPAKALFEKLFLQQDDLQVGDHVWLANHPLHRTRIASTPWNGEHSFLTETWIAKPKMRVIGHGILEQTVLDLTRKMLGEINVFLNLSRTILDRWLALPSSRKPVEKFTGKASPKWQSLLASHLLRSDPVPFEGEMRFFNMPAISYKRRGKTAKYPAHWVMDLEGKDLAGPHTIDRKQALFFDYAPDAKEDRIWVKDKPWRPLNPIALLRDDKLVAMPGLQEKHHYAVSYLDDFLGLAFFLPLYHPIAPHRRQPMLVTFEDVKSSIFFGSKDGKIHTVRPRVAVDPPYLAYLKAIGATA